MRPRRRVRAPLDRPDRPLIVAHRGASFEVAEHTESAYLAAIASGADALECDVRLTRDGHLVCVHDRRVDRTSDGRGVVSEFDLAGLSALDFSSWHTPADGDGYLAGVVPDRDARGGVLTLDRLLGLVRDAGREVGLLVETKHPTRYAGLVEKELVRLLARYGWAGEPGPVSSVRRRPAGTASGVVTVMSFAPIALRRVRLLAPDIPTVLLMERFLPGRRDGLLPAGVGIAGPDVELLAVEPGYVARAHERGNRVYVWTADTIRDIDFVLELGADAIITNRPDLALTRRAQYEARNASAP